MKPKSENFSNSKIQEIVSKLEIDFDSMKDTIKHLNPSIGTQWKEEALQKTIYELPKIKTSGTESGAFPGLSKSIFMNDNEIFENSCNISKLLNSSGYWKGSVELRKTLSESNPALKRTSIIQANSGRYNDSLVADHNRVSILNPTGKLQVSGAPISKISWKLLKEKTIDLKHINSNSSKDVTFVLIGRSNEGIFDSYYQVLSKAYQKLLQNDLSICNIYYVDVCEDSTVLNELQIRQLPIFYIFKGYDILYRGLIGGRNISIPSGNSKVLLLHSNFKQQVSIERCLKREFCDVFLLLDCNEAYNQLLFSLKSIQFAFILIDEEILCNDNNISKFLSKIRSWDTFIVVLSSNYNVLNKLKDNNGLVSLHENKDLSSKLTDSYGQYINEVDFLAQYPLRPSGIKKILLLSKIKQNTYPNLGISSDKIIEKVMEIVEGKISKPLNSDNAHTWDARDIIKLPTEDIQVNGKYLVKTSR